MKQVVIALIQSDTDVPRYLLATSKKFYDTHGVLFYPPGGHMLPSETKEDALKRKLKEELGVDIAIHAEIATLGADVENQVTYVLSASIVSGDITPAEDIGEWGFFSIDEIKQLPLWPESQKFFETYVFDSKKDGTS